jgi:hypothetical protein
MARFSLLILVFLFGLGGCMEEEKEFSSKQTAGEVQPPDSGGADISVVEVSQGTDAANEEDVTDAVDAAEVAADVETSSIDTEEVSDAMDAEIADEVAAEVADTSDATEVTETVDDAEVSVSDADAAVDATETQDAQDVPDVSVEDTDSVIEIAGDVSVVIDADDTSDVAADTAEVLEEVAGGDAVVDVQQDIAPDAPPDVTSQDIQGETSPDVPPPDPCLTLNCDDKNPCTLDSCSKTLGCSNAPTVVMCEDGNACTVGDVCISGTCTAGAPTKCNDGNPCTTDSCDPKFGCFFAPNSLACEDGDICTEGEKCSSGSCTAGQTKNCSDGNVCTSDACDSVKGCENKPMTGVCSDGNACTESDFCSAGSCFSGTAKACDDGNACTSNVCDQAKGCVNAPNWVFYDLEDAKLPLNWTLGGNMQVTCSFGNEFKTKCVFLVPQGAPAYTTSFAELDLDKVRASYKMGESDLNIRLWSGRFQFVNNMDTMMSSIVDGAGKNILSKVLDGATGTAVLQKFIVPKSGLLLRLMLVLTEKPLLTGPAVWGRVLIAPVECTPPVTP